MSVVTSGAPSTRPARDDAASAEDSHLGLRRESWTKTEPGRRPHVQPGAEEARHRDLH